MNGLVEAGFMREMKCGDDFAFVLEEDNMLVPTEYKVLQGQADGNFIKCMKLLYNGKIQLYYLTNGMASLGSLVPSLDSEMFFAIVVSLFTNIVAVRNNGFLSCQNIDISFEHIFVDLSKCKTSLVYLPLGRRLYNDVPSFENELRVSLVRLIQNSSALTGSKIEQLKDNLSNGRMALEDVLTKIRNTSDWVRPDETMIQDGAFHGSIKLMAINTPVPIEIAITKDEFILGRKEEWVDAVVSSSKQISRKHCKITRRGNVFEVVDLSSMGTYVNGVRVNPQKSKVLKDGDMIRMAYLEFKVVIS
mgnify:CR=1 FL=1